MAELDILRLDRGIIEGDITRVNSALLIGASPDGDKNAAKKPIHFAVENDAIQIVELLCEWGAKVNVPNPEEQNGSPLHMAVKKGFTSVAKCLLEKNADPNVKDGEGDTPLITAIRKGGISSAGLLLKYGADLKKRDKIHDSALHIAVKKNDGEIVQMLLKEGASVNNINMQGDFTIHMAARNASEWILETLKEKGCDINQRHRDGSSPLHLAAESGNLEAVKWFLRNGAKLDDLDAADKTPTDRAKKTHVVEWIKDSKLGYRKIQTPRKRDEIGKQSHFKSNFKLGGPNEEEDAKGTRKPQAHAASRCAAEDAQHPSWLRQGTQGVPDDQMPKLLKEAEGGNLEAVKALLDKRADVEVASTARGAEKARTGAGTAAADAARGTGAAAGAETAAVGGRPAETARNGIGAETGGQGVTMELRTLEEYRNCVDRAMACDDFKSLIELMENGIDVDTLIYESNDQGIRAVHYAAKKGEMEMLETLKDKNFDLKALTHKGFTALHCAVLTGQLDAVQWLVSEAGLDVASPSKGGETALDLANVLNRDDIGNYLMQIQGQKAFQEDDVNAMRALLGKGFNVNTILREKENKECRPLHLAAARGHTTIVNILLQNEADINTKNYEGMTPLHLASLAGNEEVIKALVEKGADWNTETTDGMMAIHLASIGGHVSAMEALAPVCDIASVTRDGKSALHLAAEHGNLAAVQWLTRKGLDLSLKDHSGRTSLQYAKNEGQKKVVEFLENFEKYHSPQNLTQAVTSGDVDAVRKILLYKVDLERPSHLNQENDRRVLHTAALFGHVDIIRELLKAGAAKDARDRMGLQAVHYAAKGGNIEALKLLKECQCDLTTRTIKGDMVLHYATEGGHLAAVQWLCEHAGLGLNTLNNAGETALDVARRKGDINTVIYLQNAKHQRELQELQNELKNKDAEIAELKRKM